MVFLDLLDVSLFVLAAYNVYWQSQIELKASYNLGNLLIAILFLMWLLMGEIAGLGYLVLVAIVTVVNLMDGEGGLTATRLIIQRFSLKRSIKISEITNVDLTIVMIGKGEQRVLAKFVINNRGTVNMVFNESLAKMQQMLRQRIGQQIPIKIM